MQGTMLGARRQGRPRTAWMDNIKTWTGLPVEESIRMTEDRDKWRKYVHGVANPRIEDGCSSVSGGLTAATNTPTTTPLCLKATSMLCIQCGLKITFYYCLLPARIQTDEPHSQALCNHQQATKIIHYYTHK